MGKHYQNILIAASDKVMLKYLLSALSGPDYKIITASDGIEALYIAERSKAEVVLLDSEIEKISASDVAFLIKKIPQLKDAYIFFLHPRDFVFKTREFVDEYVEKSAGLRALATRIRNISRIPLSQSSGDIKLKMVVGALTVDRDAYKVYYKGIGFALPKKEFELIYLLASRPEKVFTREEIFKHIWHKEITPREGRTIDVHIRKLRSKISEDIITTIKGIGYKLVI